MPHSNSTQVCLKTPSLEQGRQGRQLLGVGSWRPCCRNLDSKGAKVANFWGSGVGTLAGQKLYSKGAK